MYKEIDLHGMNSEDALRIFIQKYNEMIRKNEKKEICVIHGYGSKRLDSSAVLRENLRKFLSKQREKLRYRVDLNPGVTYVMPIMLLEERGKRKK